MARQDASMGTFAALGRALDESMGMLSDLRAGKLSRAQFEEWYDRRRRMGADMLFRVRDATAGLREPIEVALDIGRGLVEGPAARRPRAARRRARRGARASARRRTSARA